MVLLFVLWDCFACIFYGTHPILAVNNVNYGENDDGK